MGSIDAAATSSLQPRSVCSIQRSMGNLQFANGRVSIAFLQPEDVSVAATQELGSFAAERQCRAHIASHPTDEFLHEH